MNLCQIRTFIADRHHSVGSTAEPWNQLLAIGEKCPNEKDFFRVTKRVQLIPIIQGIDMDLVVAESMLTPN